MEGLPLGEEGKEGVEFKINTKGCIFEGKNCKRFDSLCEKYACIFSKSEADLGKTDLFYHGIDLTTKNPV